MVHFFGLNECQCLKEFIHGTKTTREDDKSFGIFDEHGFAHKEVTEIKRDVKVWIRFLFKGQFYIAAYRVAFTLLCSSISCFHYARTAASYNAKACFSKQAR